MKKIVLSIAASFVSFFVSAQVTQSASDTIVLERMSRETRQYTLYAKEGVQTEFTITTVNEEILEFDYSCWVYYINYLDETNANYYLIVKESNGNILQINTKNTAQPDDLANWRIIPDEPLDTFVLIAQRSLYGNGQEGIIKQSKVITTETEWENLKIAMNTVNNVTDSFTETYIDFSKYQVIVIFDILKINDGWTIDITDITEYTDSIEITYTNLQTGNSTFVITQPFYIAKIPLSEKPIVFHDETIGSNTLIAKGNLSGREGIFKQNLVIKTQTAWNSLINLMDSSNNESSNFMETVIDFSKYQVIAIFDVLKVNDGWSIDVTDITEYTNKIEVTIQNLEKGDSNIKLTRPYYIVKIPVTGKNIVFQMETSNEQPQSGCDCSDELFYYYQGNKMFIDTLLLNDYLLVACDTLIQSTEMINYINQMDLFNPVNTSEIIYTGRKDYHLLFVNTKINRSCSQLKGIISFLENNPLISFANLTFDTDAWFSGVYMDVMFYVDEFIVNIQNVNDLFDLNSVLHETNTHIKEQNQFTPTTYIISADKYSSGNALQMANYFFETGKFVYTEPNFGWGKINR